MSVLDLSRLQFAVTTSIHWLFVMVTMGLVVVLVILQTRALLTRDPGKRELLYRMTRYWGMLYVINYAMGIASGIIMEFQFGTNWSGLSHMAGDVLGVPLAVETLVAFVAESTFLALWIFGWGRLPEWIHTLLIWLVAVTAYASAFWVLVANGFMQDPTGYELVDGRANLVDPAALFASPNAIMAFSHICGAALAAGGVILTVVSAAYLFRRTPDQAFFVRSFRMGYLVGMVGLLSAFGTGWAQYGIVTENQPAKSLDALTSGGEADAVQAELVAQFGQGDYLLPAGLFAAFTVMMMVAELFGPVMLFASPLVIWRLPAKLWWLMPVFWLALPLPFLAAVAGWVFREMGRQPWIIYGVQRTSEAVSDNGIGMMWTSFIAFTAILLVLLVTNWWLLARHAVRGPNRELFGVTPVAPPAPAPVAAAATPRGALHG
ncbi:cytochrome d ubiquinol oxidase subunit I [Stackebrandtia albiflava]|uniref:Cytochrome d ubiquinol oxidase subunit I n=1 Tax=Stackebrandtia albiflava TaxID=406432 RepID=A0A562UZ22_9ACTN|nr:cytochrome ubiquinol oxidase subunit I [Stackebrandtia albiflava]TWJ10852.1 cytochrome d ubiquinol oxidase subunit I [Stackebrandtia albiflava]